MLLARAIFCSSLTALLYSSTAPAQSVPESTSSQATSTSRTAGCGEAPITMCVPPFEMEPLGTSTVAAPAAKITLQVPTGTPLRIALDQRVRISRPGEVVHGQVVETIYAFDQAVIPAGTVVIGRVTAVHPVSAKRRTLAYANGDFSPVHDYEVTFDRLRLPDGRQLPIRTTALPGTAQVVHLVSNPERENQKSAAGRAADNAKQEAKGKIREAKQGVHDSWEKLAAPGKMHRLKGFVLAQMPYRRQYLEVGTRFVADLDAPLDFGNIDRTAGELVAVGNEPAPDSTLKARLVAEVSSATASRGTAVDAILTEPLYSPTHQLILPANSRLVGEVIMAKPAHKLHRNGELRLVFERIETSEDGVKALSEVQAALSLDETENRNTRPNSRAMIGNLEGVEVTRSANMKLDQEGGAHTVDSKTRYLSTGLAVLLAAAATHTDNEHGTTDASGDPGVRTAAGGSGSRLTGALLSLAVKSQPVSIAFGAYGASASVYSHFLSRGRDVVLPKDTPLEIGFGVPHATASQTKVP